MVLHTSAVEQILIASNTTGDIVTLIKVMLLTTQQL